MSKSLLNSVQIPTQILEDIFSDKFTERETKVLLFICRKTIGFNEETQWITLQYLVSTLPGFHKPDASNVLKSLEEKGAIVRVEAEDKPGGWYVSLNTERWGVSKLLTEREQITNSHILLYGKKLPGDSEDGIRGVEVSSQEEYDIVEVDESMESKAPKSRAKYPNAKKVFVLFPHPQKSWGMNTTECKYAELLYERGIEQVVKALRFVKEHKDDDHFYVVTKPSDLEKKWLDIFEYKTKKGL